MARIHTWYQQHGEILSRLSTLTLWGSNLGKAAPDLCDMFDGLRRLEQPRTRGRKFGSAAVAKTLHPPLPDVCAIWDERWIRDLLDLGEEAWA